TKLENGMLTRMMAKKPTTVFNAGDTYRCRLTITSPGDMEYVAIEDPIPSNARIVDVDEADSYYDWEYWWARSSFFDDKATFFASHLSKGEHVIEYAIRAEVPGKATALPARAYPMYQFDVLARTGHLKFEVRK